MEGPRDRGLLEAWARRVSPALGVGISRATVILGGCRPLRAAEHFRRVVQGDGAARGLCVLDRDRDARPPPVSAWVQGLDFFMWRRRHIESYLLVPEAIRRSLRLPPEDPSVARFFRQALPEADDEEAMRQVEAKPLFGERGELAQWLGRPVQPGRVARAMWQGEIHADVHELLGRLRAGLEGGQTTPSLRR